LERAGLRSVTAGSASWPPPSDPIEVLTQQEQRALALIEWAAVFLAAVAGAISAGVCAWVAAPLVGEMDQHPLHYWTVVGATLGGTTLVELAFLYWLSLRAVREMAKAAGLRVNTKSELDLAVALALARAALELPNPPHNLLDVDPHQEASRIGLIAATLLYKAKIALTNFILKTLVRRALGRAITRATLEWIALPVGALWNAVVMYLVLREARLRVMGPSAAVLLADWIFDAWKDDAEGRQLVLRAVGTSIVANREAHPNVLALVRLLRGGYELPADVDWGARQTFLKHLEAANPKQQLSALRTLVSIAILDGKVTKRERQWLEETFTRVGKQHPADVTRELEQRFVHGKGLPLETLPRDFE
jgi:hypothetical protein